jgi:putative membrane protein (TIGR04086 family)
MNKGDLYALFYVVIKIKKKHKFVIGKLFFEGGFAMKDNRVDNRLKMSVILKSVGIGYGFSLICFLLLAVLVTFTKLSENIVPMVTQGIIIIGLTISGAGAAIKSKTRGWLYGIICGVLFVGVLIIVSWIAVDGFTFDKYVLSKVLLGIAVGAIGGMIGINLVR